MSQSASRTAFFLLLVIYAGFISLGLPDGTLGVAWPAMAKELGLPIGAAGAITIVTTLLSGLSGFASGRIVGRFGTGPVVLASCALTGMALLGISRAAGLPWLVALAVPLGLGAGAVDAGLNGYVARHYSGRHMNWLHASWGIGATTGPLVMGEALASSHGWRGGYLVIGMTQLGLAMLFLATMKLWSLVPERAAHEAAGGLEKVPTALANSLAGWLSPVLFALYAALEMSVGLWAASVLVVAREFSAERAAWCAAGFYGAITLGRVLVGFVADRVGNRRVVALGALVALAGTGLFVFARSEWLAALALGAIGLGFAPIYPGLMHEVPRRFAPEAAQTVIGRQSGAAYLGMAALPAALGWLAQRSLDSVPAVIAGGTLVLFLGIRRLDRLT